jgi:Plasma-membrane choline transporter
LLFIAILLLWGFVLKPESSSCADGNTTTTVACDPVDTAKEELKDDALTLKGKTGHHVLAISAACGLAGIVLSFLYLSIVQRFAKALIWGTLILSILIWVGYAVALFAFGQVIPALVFLALACVWVILAFCWRRRIPFAAAMLTTISGTLREYPAPIYVAWASIPVQIVWFVVWVSTFIAAERLRWVNGYAFWLFLLVSLYWVAQVIKNVVHVTAAGTFASWYFYAKEDTKDARHGHVGMPPNPTLHAFKRSVTTSFGSICLGSLIVAILQTLRTLARLVRRGKGNHWALRMIACCCECMLSVVERLLQYFNLYAFSLVAIYGMTYWQSAKETMHLIRSHGIEAIINDDLIVPVLTMGCVAGGLVCGAVGGLMALSLEMAVYIPYMAVLGFLIGFIMMIVALSVVESGVVTIFVCFALDPEALRRNNPHLYHKFTSTYRLY